jgi:hypothetical protein
LFHNLREFGSTAMARFISTMAVVMCRFLPRATPKVINSATAS